MPPTTHRPPGDPLFPHAFPHVVRPASARRRLAAGLLTACAVVVAPLAAPPASAASTAASVATKADLAALLQQAADGSPTTIRLDQDLIAPDAASDALRIPDGSTIALDLDGRRLDLVQLVIGEGASLDVTDSTGTGTGSAGAGVLQVGATPDPSSDDPTGIAIGSDALLQVDGARVVAFGSDAGRTAGIGSTGGTIASPGRLALTGGAVVSGQGGRGGAGIGGAQASAAIAVSVVDSRLVGRGGVGGAGIGSGRDGVSFGGLSTTTTVLEPSDRGDYSRFESSIDGAGGPGAAGIGGGLHASGGTVRLDGNTDANVSTAGAVTGAAGSPSAVGAGQAPTATSGVFGSLRVGRYAWLWVNDPQDVLIVPADASVRNDGSIRALGGITGDGEIVNHGDVSSTSSAAPPAAGSDPAALITIGAVSGHDYLLRLHGGDGTVPGRDRVRVLCAYLDPAVLVAAVATQPGRAMAAWNTKADGTGEDFVGQSLEQLTGDESTDGTPVVLDLWARYRDTLRFTASSMAPAALDRPYDQALPIAGDGSGSAWISGDGDAIATLPAGLVYDPVARRVRGTPTESGEFRFRVRASGDAPLDGWVTLTVDGPPVIPGGALPDATVGEPYSLRLSAVAHGAVRWTVVDGALPAGLTLGLDGVLSGTPSAAGSAGFTLQAADEYGSGNRTASLIVVAAPVSDVPPASTSVPAPTAAPPTDKALPSRTNPSGGAGEDAPHTAITTTSPTKPSAGAGSVDVAAAAPVVVAAQRLQARLGHPLTVSLRAASLSPVTYSVRGALPTGTTLGADTGLIRGVPSRPGTFTATVTATNASGATSTRITVVVPARRQLITIRGARSIWPSDRGLPLTLRGLRAGERFRVLVDGHVVQTGERNRSSAVHVVVGQVPTSRDVTRHVEVVVDRDVVDPATTASTSFVVTLLAPRKQLRAVVPGARRGSTVLVQGLVRGEKVTITRRGAVVARGRADARGEYPFPRRLAGRATGRLVATGATAGRRVVIVVVTAPRR